MINSANSVKHSCSRMTELKKIPAIVLIIKIVKSVSMHDTINGKRNSTSTLRTVSIKSFFNYIKRTPLVSKVKRYIFIIFYSCGLMTSCGSSK